MKKKVPIVNAKMYREGSAQDIKDFIYLFGMALKEFGFVIIEGHDIPRNLIKNSYKIIQDFFALSLEKKLKYVDSTGWGQRGYISFGKEKAKNSSVMDLKEFWHVGREFFVHEETKYKYPKNIWPDNDVQNFKTSLLDLYQWLDDLSKDLLTALSQFLNLPKYTLPKMVIDGNSVLRALHYPPLTDTQNLSGALRAAAHEDINLLTILCEATESGLQILTRDGDWIDVESGENQMVVDSGDMLSRITNDIIPATTHRVINPPQSQNISRFSCPFFVHAHENYELKVLDNCTSPSFPFKYEPITAGAFLRERLRANGLGGN